MIALFSLCIALTTAPTPPPSSTFPDDTAATLQAAVDDVLLDTAMGTKAAFTMAVIDHGRVWRHSRGVINAKTKQKATTSTSFRLASITKTFTALAIMQLVQDGELDLDAPVTTIVPTLPASLSSVTVRHLLNHTSGIRHYPLKGEERAWKKHLTTSQTLAVFAHRPPAFSPGQSFLYTTYGYDVLGAVLEAQTKKAYADVVDERVFAPLGMGNTIIEDSRKRGRDWPVGLKLNKKGDVVAGDIIDVSSRFAGGGARGTVDDLLVYAQALLAGHVVDADTWAQMTKPTFTRDGLQNDYGLGFAVYPQRGHLVVAHAGGQPETTSLVYLLPHEDLAVVMLTNLEGQGNLQQDVAAAVVEVLREDDHRRRGLYAVDPVTHVVADGLNRAFSHGRAFVDQVAKDISVDDAAIDAAFVRFAQLTDAAVVAKDPQAAQLALREAHHPKNGRTSTLVGATIARVLREADPSSWSEWPRHGALAFFVGYGRLCQREPARCSPKRLLSSSLLTRLEASLTSIERLDTMLVHWRRGTVTDQLEVSMLGTALSSSPVRPDLHDDLVFIADRLDRRGNSADAELMRRIDEGLYAPPFPPLPPPKP